MHEVIVVGGGPAGLSATLVLARCCRDVLLCDEDRPRNYASHALNGFIGREHANPRELRSIAREELAAYPTVTLCDDKVTEAKRDGAGFRVTLGSGKTAESATILLATGVEDELPPLEGIADYFGTSVFNCPYCDAFEVRGKALGAFGPGERGYEMAMTLTGWSQDVTLLTNGAHDLSSDHEAQLARSRVKVEDAPISSLEGEGGRLRSLRLQNGERREIAALFFNTPSYPHSRLASSLGCRFSDRGRIETKAYNETDAAGVYAAGNVTEDIHLAIAAAADGARAAFGINKALARGRS